MVHTYTGHENQVEVNLRQRIKSMGAEGEIFDVLVPNIEEIEIKEGQRRTISKKLFPGYVLVQMDMDEGSWHLVKECPKVLGFIGGRPDKPAPITDAEAEKILGQCARLGLESKMFDCQTLVLLAFARLECSDRKGLQHCRDDFVRLIDRDEKNLRLQRQAVGVARLHFVAHDCQRRLQAVGQVVHRGAVALHALAL